MVRDRADQPLAKERSSLLAVQRISLASPSGSLSASASTPPIVRPSHAGDDGYFW